MTRQIICLQRFFVLLVLQLASLLTLTANAASLESLISENKLSVEIRLKSIPPIIAKQPVLFEVEVATLRWFAKGTYLVNPTVKDAVMLPASGLGINGIKKINGATWASQIREITVYPTKAGGYQLPPVEIQVSVNTENDGVVEGSVYTEALDFAVVIPLALEPYKNYIVSSNVQIDINEEHAEKESYAVGEAIRQTITLSAINVPGMMLPPLIRPEIEGLSVYHKPAQLNDKSLRGELTGIRTESFTFIFEQAGEYQIPEQSLYWWNIATQELSELTIPARVWQVTGLAFGNTDALKRGFGLLPSFRQLGLFLALVMAMLLTYAGYRHRKKLHRYYAQLTRLQYRTSRKAFLKAVERGQYQLACDVLYQLVNQSSKNVCSLKDFYGGNPSKLPVLDQLLIAAYGMEGNRIHLDCTELSRLLEKPAKKSSRSNVDFLNGMFQLNPKG